MRNLVTQGTCLQWRCLASAVSGHCPPSQVAAGHALVHRPLHASLSPIPYCRPLGAIPASQWCPLPSVPPATSAPRTLSPPPACPPIYRGHRHYRRDRRDLPISAYIGVIGGPPIGVIGTIGVIGGSPIGVIGGPPIGVIGTIGVYRCDRRYRWLSSSSALSVVHLSALSALSAFIGVIGVIGGYHRHRHYRRFPGLVHTILRYSNFPALPKFRTYPTSMPVAFK